MLYRFHIDDSALNRALYRGFEVHQNDPGVRRTHLFGGRYENIYLTVEQVPELQRLLDSIHAHAGELLGTTDLRYGLWFNDMPPGAVTTRHTHDNEDELLSCVYYVSVPEDSGDLLLHQDGETTRITPREGDLYFFSPKLEHEVTVNNSDRNRLSIAINFGPRDMEDEHG